MNGKELRESLGLLLVAGSMVFVGLEIRQNTTVARAATRQAMADSDREWMMAMASDSSLMMAYQERFQESPPSWSTLSSNYAMVANLRMLENVFLQFQEGVVPEEVLNSYGWRGRPLFDTPEFRDWWLSRRDQLFSPDFVAAFEAANDIVP